MTNSLFTSAQVLSELALSSYGQGQITTWQDVFCVMVLLADENQETNLLTKAKIGESLYLTESETVYALRQIKASGWAETISYSKVRSYGGTRYRLSANGMAQCAEASIAGEFVGMVSPDELEFHMDRIRQYTWGQPPLDRLRKPVVARAIHFINSQSIKRAKFGPRPSSQEKRIAARLRQEAPTALAAQARP